MNASMGLIADRLIRPMSKIESTAPAFVACNPGFVTAQAPTMPQSEAERQVIEVPHMISKENSFRSQRRFTASRQFISGLIKLSFACLALAFIFGQTPVNAQTL